MASTVAPRTFIGISLLMLTLAGALAVLNNFKVHRLPPAEAIVSIPTAAPAPVEAAQGKALTAGDVIAADAAQAVTEAESKAAKAEAELAQAQKETADLRAKLDANESEMTSLQKNIEEATGKPAVEIPGAATASEMEAQLDESRRALDSAEQEKQLLLDKLRVARQRSVQLEDQQKRRIAVKGKPGVRGAVLAVNRAYNFVVLNLGGRQGVEVNSEMLVVRDGVLIGKIRISSVEPATAIGDIIASSLARGIQVQRGDIVIYAGSSS